jgi:hypothetical protein
MSKPNLPEPMENGRMPAYAWPGGYPLYYMTADCGILCPDCMNDNLELTKDKDDKQWYVIAANANYEDQDLWCDNCNKQIESAYGDPNANLQDSK